MTSPSFVDAYRSAAQDIPRPVAVLGCTRGSSRYAITVDSFMDVSYDPPTMAVSVYSGSRRAQRSVRSASSLRSRRVSHSGWANPASRFAVCSNRSTPRQPPRALRSSRRPPRGSTSRSRIGSRSPRTRSSPRPSQRWERVPALPRSCTGPMPTIGPHRAEAPPGAMFAPPGRPCGSQSWLRSLRRCPERSWHGRRAGTLRCSRRPRNRREHRMPPRPPHRTCGSPT